MSAGFLRRIGLRKISLSLRGSSGNTRAPRPRQHGSPVTTTANMVGVVAGVITVARVVADMTPTTVAVHHPHPRIGVTATGHVIVVLAALVSVIAPPHHALALVHPLNNLRLAVQRCSGLDSRQQLMKQWRSVHVR